MAAGKAVQVWNVLLPGSGLILRDRLGLGVPLVLLSMLAWGVLLLAGLLATAEFAGQLRLGVAAMYLVIAVAAGVSLSLLEREPPLNRERIIELHRATAQAFLHGERRAALDQARELTRAAPQLPGAWLLLATIARTFEDEAEERRATAKHRKLLARQALR